jgi:hypothetical protein
MFNEHESKRWSDLCQRHEEAKRSVDAALKVVQDKFLGVGSNGPINPTAQDIANLEDARARRAEIEREMDEFMTTRR